MASALTCGVARVTSASIRQRRNDNSLTLPIHGAMLKRPWNTVIFASGASRDAAVRAVSVAPEQERSVFVTDPRPRIEGSVAVSMPTVLNNDLGEDA